MSPSDPLYRLVKSSFVLESRSAVAFKGKEVIGNAPSPPGIYLD